MLWEGLVYSQILPIYGISNSIYVSGGQASLIDDIGDFVITFPTGFTISTLAYRKPYFALN